MEKQEQIFRSIVDRVQLVQSCEKSEVLETKFSENFAAAIMRSRRRDETDPEMDADFCILVNTGKYYEQPDEDLTKLVKCVESNSWISFGSPNNSKLRMKIIDLAENGNTVTVKYSNGEKVKTATVSVVAKTKTFWKFVD